MHMNDFLIKSSTRLLTIYLFVFLNMITYINAESGVSTFMYHRFGENKYPSTNVSETQFLSHIDYILKNNINVLSLEEVIETLKNKKKFKKKSVAFSVDDAYSSFYEIAWPIFREKTFL